ncbi:MAG: ABC transporter permease, partial [Solirubrobacteraceae bacterium]
MTAIGDPGTIFDRGSGSAFRRPIVRLLLRPELPSLVFLVVLVVVFSVTAQGFLTGANVQQIFEQVAILGIVALGLNQVILAGEIDVSMGSLLAVCAATAASVSNHVGGLVAPLAVSLAIGGAAGLLNGLLVTKARIPSIIVTLAGLYALRGAEQVLNAIGIDSVPPGVQGLGSGHILGLDSAVSVLVLCFVGVYLISRHTTWGREVSAVGGNRSAARMAGLRVDRVRLWAFVLVGLCVGLAAMVYIGEVGAVQSNAETG